MATTRRDIELRINANDLSEKTLQQLLDTFEKLRASQEAFAKSGDVTQRSVRELKQDLSDLQAVATELKGRGALVDQFLGIEKRATEAAKRVEAAKEALQRFNAAQAEGAKLTKAEEKEFKSLSREVMNAEKSLTLGTAKLEEFRKALSQIGAGDTNTTREALLRFSTDLGVSLASAEQSIRRYDEALRASTQREREATEAKRKAAAAAAELKAVQDFNQVGRDALKGAEGLDALSRDYDALAATSRKAGDGIRAIIDPSRQALSTLDGLEEQTKKLNEQLQKAASSVKLRDEVRKLRTEYGSLATDAGKAAAALADDIGTYRLTEQAVGSLRARVEEARNNVRNFAGQMASAAAPSEALAKSLATAKGQLDGLVRDFERQSTQLAKLRTDLREAGVNTDRLSDAERRLQGVARGAVAAQEALGVAAVKVGTGANKAAKGLGLFEDHGRKALSTSQRLRGELLSLASSYLGLFAAVNVAKGAIDASVSREGILRRLELVEGSAEKAKAKFEQLSATADRLGVNFMKSADGFTNIAIGAKAAGLSSEQLDHFFENLATTTRGLALTGEKTARVFTAVSQVFGKNKLQAEELTQQIGEHLPAVVTKAAAALNMTAEELQKNLEAGNISVHALVVIVDEYAKLIRGLSKQNESAVASLARFENAMDKLKLAIGDSGFLKQFTDLLEDAVRRFKAGEFDDAIKGLGDLFTLAAGAAKLLLENIELVEFAFVSLIALNVAKVLLGIAAGMSAVSVSSLAASGSVGLLGAAFGFLARNPIVALVIGLITLVAATEKGRGTFRAFMQVIEEVGGALADVLKLDFASFFDRLKNGAGRVAAAFRGAKKDAEALAEAGVMDEEMIFAKLVQANLKKRGINATITDTRKKPPTAEEAKRAVIEAENVRKNEAELTARTVTGLENKIADARKNAAKEHAKTTHNVEEEVRAEYQETYDDIAALTARAVKTNDAATAAAATKLKASLDEQVGIIVAARKARQKAEDDKAAHSGAVAEALEDAKQGAEAVKDGLRLEHAELEQSYKEGLISLREYYAKRLDQTVRGLDAEITAARKQIEILKGERGTDPKAGKKIIALEGAIAGKEKEKLIAAREFNTQLGISEKSLRRQVDAVEQELDLMTGDGRQAAMRSIDNWYADQLEAVNGLEGAEQKRARATLDTVKAIKTQLVDITLMRQEADHLYELEHARIDTRVAKGELSYLQELAARSAANAEYLKSLEAQRVALILNGEMGSEAYEKLQVEIEKAKGKTDELTIEVTKSLKTAATAFVNTLVESKSPRDAVKAFGKSLGQALGQTMVDAAATAIVDWFKKNGGFDTIKTLFQFAGGLFGGAKTAHTGAVIGYGGGVPRQVSPLAFLGAPRYHNGGLPGLRHDEVALIGLKGEEMLSRNDPRNVRNAGKNPPGAAGGPLMVQLHPDAMQMTLREWLENELARVGATQ